MRPSKVIFHVLQRNEANEQKKVALEGTLVAFGVDCSKEGGSWSTGIIVLPDGRFCNTAVELITLKDPFKEDDFLNG